MKTVNRRLIFVTGFALLNVLMYWTISKFWIGGSSFLPLIGELGPDQKFLFAFIVNVGVIVGAAIGAGSSNEFILRMPEAKHLPRLLVGGFLIGIGITLCPGTCTTSFVTGIPMLSVSSFLSAGGIILGAYLAFRVMMRK